MCGQGQNSKRLIESEVIKVSGKFPMLVSAPQNKAALNFKIGLVKSGTLTTDAKP